MNHMELGQYSHNELDQDELLQGQQAPKTKAWRRISIIGTVCAGVATVVLCVVLLGGMAPAVEPPAPSPPNVATKLLRLQQQMLQFGDRRKGAKEGSEGLPPMPAFPAMPPMPDMDMPEGGEGMPMPDMNMDLPPGLGSDCSQGLKKITQGVAEAAKKLMKEVMTECMSDPTGTPCKAVQEKAEHLGTSLMTDCKKGESCKITTTDEEGEREEDMCIPMECQNDNDMDKLKAGPEEDETADIKCVR